MIEVIDDKTMHYFNNGGLYFQVGSFSWSGHFTWVNVPDEEVIRRGGPVEPTRSEIPCINNAEGDIY